jgi:hypothetical protein
MALTDEVREWVERSGFSLEMRSAAEFRQAGFEVRQSSHYIDPDTEKEREIDVLATDLDYLGVIGIHFVIECKSTKKPWVLLASGDALTGFNRIFTFGVMTEMAVKIFAERLEEFMDTQVWLRKRGPAGYSFRQAFSEKSDPAYSAAISVAKACEYLVHPPDSRYVARIVVAFPVIVLDAPIIQCSLQADGQLQLDEVNQGEFLFVARLPRDFGSCIGVITAAYLPVFADEAKRVVGQLRAALKPEEDKVRKSWRKR